MDTNIKTLTASYVKIADDGAYGAIQNIGSGTAVLVISGSAPADADRGFYLVSGDALTSTWGDGDVYARLANSEPVDVAVTE